VERSISARGSGQWLEQREQREGSGREESKWKRALGSEEALNRKKWKNMGWFEQRSDQV